ncbi:MAG: T9SS type A sorting domain-containing protein [candidate division Zixibacteria bacterium]|nr:T9SS type A sorting domain-containing protein [candidate division Zixibacteria bacterium]MBU1469551.1 T9SS type A sorting domain-containing protein [candidate division Zixibacteria bacterium]MBU2624027.1 T9SS type A sorting domain-containing protein [candidate division Zixibacteria bacterium]
MKRNTVTIALMIVVVSLIMVSAFTNLLAGDKGGGILPPLYPCENTSSYIIKVDICSDTGGIVETMNTAFTQVSVSVQMYGMNTAPDPDTSLILERFQNRIQFNNTELEFVGIVGVTWEQDSLIWNVTLDHGAFYNINVSGVDGDLKFKENAWDTVYALKFNVLCANSDQIDLDLTIDDENCWYNSVVLDGGGFDEEYDGWGDSDPNNGPNGYAHIMEYKARAHIEEETVYLGDMSHYVTVWLDETNYMFSEFEHCITFDNTLYECTGYAPEWVAACMLYSEFDVDGDSIYIHCWNPSWYPGMDVVTSPKAMYTLEFELITPSGQGAEDNDTSWVAFNPNSENCISPYSCEGLCASTTQVLEDGALIIPEYTVDVYLEFDDDYREPGESAYLDVWIRNTFPAGLIGTGNIQLLIEHDSRLAFEGETFVNSDVNISASRVNGYDMVSITLLPGSQGYLDPSGDSVLYCTLEFAIDGEATYDCPDEVAAWVIDYFTPQHQTEVVDTTGTISCTMAPENLKLTAIDDSFVPWCKSFYANNVAGGSNVWQPVFLWTDVDIDSVNFEITWDDSKFCLLNDTYKLPGLNVTNVGDGAKWYHGSSLGISGGGSTMILNLHFGAEETGDVTGTTHIYEPFQYFTHIVDIYNETHYPAAQGGTVTTHLEVWQGSTCPNDPPPQKVAGLILPQEFALHQNYPNPFNPNTTVAFDIGTFSWVKLEIFNILGQVVATLIDSPMDAGSYEVEWNAGPEISSGVYFYRVEAGDFTDTKKMMLLK